MFSLVSDAKRFIKFNSGHVVTDNNCFRLVYRATVALHVLFTALLGARQYFGDPIDCSMHDSSVPRGMLNSYCWITGTWTVRSKGAVYHHGNRTTIHPGVGVFDHRVHDKIYHRYYQWVPTVMVFTALMLYLPRFVWKWMEGGRLANICSGMKHQVIDAKERDEKVGRLYGFHRAGRRRNQSYAFEFALCEILNLAVVSGVWWLTDLLLGGHFMDYGDDLYKFIASNGGVPITDGPEPPFSPMESVFPKMAKCSFSKIGFSGTTELIDGLCMLPLNIVNEKVYYFLWFWYILILFTSSMAIVFRLVTVAPIPNVKRWILCYGYIGSRHELDIVLRHSGYGDWFFLRQIQKNVDVEIFARLISRLAQKETEQINPASKSGHYKMKAIGDGLPSYDDGCKTNMAFEKDAGSSCMGIIEDNDDLDAKKPTENSMDNAAAVSRENALNNKNTKRDLAPKSAIKQRLGNAMQTVKNSPKIIRKKIGQNTLVNEDTSSSSDGDDVGVSGGVGGGEEGGVGDGVVGGEGTGAVDAGSDEYLSFKSLNDKNESAC